MDYALFLTALFYAFAAQAQKGHIHGRITDAATGAALPGASIAVLSADHRYGTLSTEQGRYSLSLPPGVYQLHFSFIGCAAQRPEALAVRGYTPVALDIALQPTTITLREMTVTPGRLAIMGDAAGPRLNFIYALDRKTSLRAGWGRFYQRWLSYALARVEEKIRSIGTDEGTIPFAAEVPGRFDQRHTFSVDLNYRPSGRWQVKAAWQFRSVWPHTDRALFRGETAGGDFFYATQIGEPNGSRYPSLHRLYLRLNRVFKTSNGQVHAFLELINFYNNGNVRSYEYILECANTTTPDWRYRKVPEF